MRRNARRLKKRFRKNSENPFALVFDEKKSARGCVWKNILPQATARRVRRREKNPCARCRPRPRLRRARRSSSRRSARAFRAIQKPKRRAGFDRQFFQVVFQARLNFPHAREVQIFLLWFPNAKTSAKIPVRKNNGRLPEARKEMLKARRGALLFRLSAARLVFENRRERRPARRLKNKLSITRKSSSQNAFGNQYAARKMCAGKSEVRRRSRIIAVE